MAQPASWHNGTPHPRPKDTVSCTNIRSFGTQHQRDSRSALFAGYEPQQRTASPSAGYGYNGGYGYSGGGGSSGAGTPGGYRSATPNRKGQYSDAVLNELESQNDAQITGILGKVKTLKDVRCRLRSGCFASMLTW